MPDAGQIVGNRYRLIRPLGMGGMAAVWHAEHVAMGRAVAIKLIAPELLQHPLALTRFRSEARAAASLSSQHVVQLFDYDVDPELGPYIAMELLEGESLGARLARYGVLGPSEVVGIITQVCKGLTRAHAASIIHRDLKPENIFLVPDEDGTEIAKVLDFGVAKVPLAASAGVTTVGLLVGTLSHMSPEQATSRPLDHRADLYSLGIIAYQCLIGEIPFEQESVGAWIVAICMQPLPIPSSSRPDLPAAFDSWFARACARDPSERFQSAQELSAALVKAFTARPRLLLAEQPDSIPPEAPPAGCYFILHGGTTVGPVDPVLLKRGIAAGKVPATAFAWRDGWTEWRPVGELAHELASIHVPPETPPPPGNGLLALGRPSMLPRTAPSTLPAGRIELQAPRTPEFSRPGHTDTPADDRPCYYVSDGDSMVGPVSGALLRKGLEAGRVAASATVWRDGWDAWKTAEEVLATLQPLPARAPPLFDRPGIQAIGMPSILPPSAPVSVRQALSVAPRRAPTISFIPEFYVAEGGLTVGPVSGSLLRKGVDSGRVPPTALVWTEGWDAWRAVADIAVDLATYVSTAPETLRDHRGIEALGHKSIVPPHAPSTTISPRRA